MKEIRGHLPQDAEHTALNNTQLQDRGYEQEIYTEDFLHRDTMLNTLHVLTYLIFASAPQGGRRYHSCSTDKDADVQRLSDLTLRGRGSPSALHVQEEFSPWCSKQCSSFCLSSVPWVIKAVGFQGISLVCLICRWALGLTTL